MKNTLAFLFAIISSAILGCGKTPTTLADGGSATEVVLSLDGSLVNEDGSHAVGTAVYLRPKDYLGLVQAKMLASHAMKTLDSTLTDSLGNFSFDSIAAGTYTLECLDGEDGNGALIDSVVIEHPDSALELATDTLKPLGSIAGKIQLPESPNALPIRISVYGLARVSTPDLSGNFSIPNLPEGKYALHITGQGFLPLDLKNDSAVQVTSGQTTNIPASLLLSADSGLVAYWSFDENSGQVINDASGNGNSGILGSSASVDSKDPVWAVGKIGSCLQFDSANDSRAVVNVAQTALDSLKTFTYEAWINPTDWGRYARILSQETAAKDGFYICLYGYAWHNYGASISDINTNYTVDSDSNSLVLNTWQHIAVTFDDAGDRTLHLFVNGLDAGYVRPPSAVTGALRFNSGPMVIGNSTISNQSFMGKIDEIKVYNRVLSQAEIQQEASR